MQLSQKDEDILEHLTNIASEELEGEEDEDGDEIAGFRLSFHFAKNPFFDHAVLVSPAHGGMLPPCDNWFLDHGDSSGPFTGLHINCLCLQQHLFPVTLKSVVGRLQGCTNLRG